MGKFSKGEDDGNISDTVLLKGHARTTHSYSEQNDRSMYLLTNMWGHNARAWPLAC